MGWRDGPKWLSKGQKLFTRRQAKTPVSRKHRRKLSHVKDLWIASGLLMLIYPAFQFVITLALLTTFISFSILDETM